MIKDARKNLELSYNSLNLLSELKEGTTVKAKYTYAADGTKLAVKDLTGADGYYYRGSLVYKANGTLESGAFGDGRILKSTNGYDLNYYLTDHLGSVRTIFNGSGAVLAQNDYYPFGGKHSNSAYSNTATNRWLYNGKEEQTTGNLGYLDYDARMYDAQIGRWFGVDPAEQYASGYIFCGNNPMMFIDPNGMMATWYLDEIGNPLLNTNDGSRAIVTVPNDMLDEFKYNVFATFGARGESFLNSKGWNYWMKERLTGIDWNDGTEAWLDRLHDPKAIQISIEMLSGKHYTASNLDNVLKNADKMSVIGTGLTIGGYLTSYLGSPQVGKSMTTIGNAISAAGTVIELGTYLAKGDRDAFYSTLAISFIYGGRGSIFSKFASGGVKTALLTENELKGYFLNKILDDSRNKNKKRK